MVGVTLAAGRGVRWSAIGHLAIVWASAPVAVFLLGASLTKGLDRVARGGRTGTALVVVGAIAAFAMGANDVSNASGALVGTHVFGPLGAGYVFGLLVR